MGKLISRGFRFEAKLSALGIQCCLIFSTTSCIYHYLSCVEVSLNTSHKDKNEESLNHINAFYWEKKLTLFFKGIAPLRMIRTLKCVNIKILFLINNYINNE